MSSESLKTNRICFNALLSAHEKPLEWRHSLEALKRMARSSLEPDVVSSSTAVSCMEKCRQWLRALGLLAAGPFCQVSLHAAMSACGKSAWLHALGLLRQLKVLRLSFNNVTYTVALEATRRAIYWLKRYRLKNMTLSFPSLYHIEEW